MTRGIVSARIVADKVKDAKGRQASLFDVDLEMAEESP